MKKLYMLLVLGCIGASAVMAQTKAGRVDTAKHPVFYTCPQHPEVTSKKPGMCPKCGMALNRTPKEEMKASETKNFICPVHVDIVRHQAGRCPQCGRKMNLSPKEQMKEEVVRARTCPMHPDVALDKDGKCPKCKKDEAGGQDHH